MKFASIIIAVVGANQTIAFSPTVSTSLLLLEGTLLFCGFILSLIQADILAWAFLLWSYFFFALMAGKNPKA